MRLKVDALTRTGTTHYRGLRRCSDCTITFTADGPVLDPYHCNLPICERCAAVNGKASARKYVPRLVDAIRDGSSVCTVTLTQARRPLEPAKTAFNRLDASLKEFWKLVNRKRTKCGLVVRGALVGYEAGCSQRRGYHAHAHIVWVGETPDVMALTELWKRCSPGASVVDVHPFNPGAHPEVADIRERLVPLVTYLQKGVLSVDDPDNPDDYDAWASAALALRRKHKVAARGNLHASFGAEKTKAGKPKRKKKRDVDSEWAPLPTEDDPEPMPPHPDWLPRSLSELIGRLEKGALYGRSDPDFCKLVEAAKRLLPAWRAHEVYVMEACKRKKYVSPAAYELAIQGLSGGLDAAPSPAVAWPRGPHPNKNEEPKPFALKPNSGEADGDANGVPDVARSDEVWRASSAAGSFF